MTTLDEGNDRLPGHDTTQPFDVRDPLVTVIRAALARHWRLAALAFAIVFVPGAWFAWKRSSPTYLAEASLHVAPRFPKTLEEDSEVESQTYNYQAFVSQQVHLLKRYEVLEDALNRLGPARAYWQRTGESDSEAIDRLALEIEARHVPDSFLLSVALESGRSEGLAEVVNAVVDAYLEAQRAENFFEPGQRIEDLKAHRGDVQQQIATRMEQQRELALKLGVTEIDASSPGPQQLQYANATGMLAQARMDLITARAEREALAGADALRVAIAATEPAAAGPPSDDAGARSLVDRRSELQTLMSGLTEQHPGFIAYAKQLERIDGLILENARASAEARIALAQRQLDSLQAECDELKLATFGHAIDYAAAGENVQSIAAGQARLREIDERITFLGLESAGPGFVRLFSRARTPENPTRDRRLKYFLAILVLASGVGVGAGLVAHSLDRRIHSSADLERLLGFPPIVALRRPSPRVDADGEELGNHIRRLALSIDREHRRNTTGIFVITATYANPWTATLVARIARELSTMGLRVLTVDANLTANTLSNGNVGLIDVLKGNTELAMAIVPGTPSHIPLGNGSGYQRLPYGHRLGGLLNTIAPGHDIVLIDGPPILQSVDAELFVDADQATLLVVKADSDTSDEVRKAVVALRSLSPRAFGAILDQTGGDSSLGTGPARRSAQESNELLVAAGHDSGGSDRWM